MFGNRVTQTTQQGLRRDMSQMQTSRYRALKAVQEIMRVAGWVLVVLGLTGLVLAIAVVVGMAGPYDLAAGSAAAGFGAVVAGIFQIGVSEALRCLRDIAINSHAIRQSLDHLPAGQAPAGQ